VVIVLPAIGIARGPLSMATGPATAATGAIVRAIIGHPPPFTAPVMLDLDNARHTVDPELHPATGREQAVLLFNRLVPVLQIIGLRQPIQRDQATAVQHPLDPAETRHRATRAQAAIRHRTTLGLPRNLARLHNPDPRNPDLPNQDPHSQARAQAHAQAEAIRQVRAQAEAETTRRDLLSQEEEEDRTSSG
jgi:hypothetical protein